MNAYVGTALSANLARSPEGYLIARNSPVSRTAERTPLLYSGSELGFPSLDQVPVWRSAQELFSPASLASLESKVFVSPHPPRFLTAADTSGYSKGHVRNVRRGE